MKPSVLRQIALWVFVLIVVGFIILITSPTTVYAGSSSAVQNDQAGGQPLQLIFPGENHETLIINETTMSLLSSWSDLPIAFVAVCGPLHSGKSFLSNQLKSLNTSGFKLGPTTRPETRGVWMWSEPLRVRNHLVVFLDTEGLFSSNTSEVYDAKIFAISSLISSVLVYNTVKFIDQSSIEYMEMLIRRAQLFDLKSRSSATEQGHHQSVGLGRLGDLVWVVQDFVQEMHDDETSDEWLQSLLDGHVDETSGVSVSVLDLFRSVHCRTLFLPDVRPNVLTRLNIATYDELLPEYRRDVESLRDLVLSRAMPKIDESNVAMIAPMMVKWLRILVDAANYGSFPTVPSVWSGFIAQQVESARADAVKYFGNNLDDLMKQWHKSKEKQYGSYTIMPQKDVVRFVESSRESSRNLFSSLTLGMAVSSKQSKQLDEDVEQRGASALVQHRDDSRSRTRHEFEKIKQDLLFDVSKLELPLNKRLLVARFEEFRKTALRHARDGTMRLILEDGGFAEESKSFVHFADSELERLNFKNSELVAEAVTSAADNALDGALKFLTAYTTTPLDAERLGYVKKGCMALAEERFGNLTVLYFADFSKLVYQSKSGLLAKVDVMFAGFAKSNAVLVVNEIKKMVKNHMFDISRSFDSQILPQTIEHLEAQCTHIVGSATKAINAVTRKYTGIEGVEEELLRFEQHYSSERDELFRRNNVKYDMLLDRSIPMVRSVLEAEVNKYWLKSAGIESAKKIIVEQLMQHERVTDKKMAETMAERYVSLNFGTSFFKWSMTDSAILFLGLVTIFVLLKFTASR